MHRILKLIYIIISILSVASEKNNDNNQHMQSKDIHVEAFATTRILQLNITLMKRIQKAYEIQITSVYQDDEDKKFCPPIFHCLSYVSPNIMSTVIPENSFYRTDNDCIFHNDCYYNITVRSFDGTFDESILFHSKECVSGLCACKHSSKLPIPRINSSIIDLNQLYFKWQIDNDQLAKLPNSTYLQFLTIEVHELKKCNFSWTYRSSLASFHEDLNQYGILRVNGDYRKHLNSNMTSECLRIRMNVVDDKNCLGPKLEKMIKIPKREYEAVEKTFTNKFVLITVVCVLSSCGTIMITIYSCVWWHRKKNTIKNWRGIYNNNTQHGSSGLQMIPMRENPIYIKRDSVVNDSYDIPLSSIKEIGIQIGKGAFGKVYIAQLNDIPGKFSAQTVAIKKLKTNSSPDQIEEFLSEISTMKRVGKHPNVVRLLGSCTVDNKMMMVMEYVPCGDLLRYLRVVRAKHESSLNHNQFESQLKSNSNSGSSKGHSISAQTILGPFGKYLDIFNSHSTSSASETSAYITQPDSLPPGVLIANGAPRPLYAETKFTNSTVPSNPELKPMIPSLEYVVDHTELHNFAMQIALGMKHLEEKEITHRDLAARNILIDEKKNLKISDFGLSREGIYVNTKNKKVPLRWLSIEAIKDNLYSSKSDVWAFAIVLWEIGTLGGFPYPTIQNQDILNFLVSGNRLEKPENCSDSLYELMLQCWTTDPDDRPNFSDICKKLDTNKNKIYIDFSELNPNYVFPPTSNGMHTNDKNNKKLSEKLSKD